jgi:EAL domain-containing protein (putative c-di-GMP-specific phosphodiesterase class I)
VTNFRDWLKHTQARRAGIPRLRTMQGLPGVLTLGDLSVVYQPIVSLATMEPFAHEALVRSNSPHWIDPPKLFDEAIQSRCVGALGRAIRELSTTHCPGMPLFLNVHPNEFDESWLVQPDDPIFTHDSTVYLEVTESVPLTHFAYCHSVLREIRGKGVLLAVDDLGAGYSNLKYIADLKPEMVKLDRTLIADLADDRRAQVLVRHIVQLCHELGARVVAEGIELETEMQVVIDCGADYGQGYYFAYPAYPAPGVNEAPIEVMRQGADQARLKTGPTGS